MERVIVSILILGAPKSGWPDGTEVTRGAHIDYTESTRPNWLSTALAYNRDHCARYNHPLEVVQALGPEFFPFQRERCDKHPPDSATSSQRRNCYMGAHRENCTWYKLRWLLQHLMNNTAEYILFIDCDAIIKTYPEHDTVNIMIDYMNSMNGVDMLVADEDWQCVEKGTPFDRCSQKGATNTGVILVRNCEWVRTYLAEIVSMQEDRRCGSNEQACFRALYGRNTSGARAHIHIDSGLMWNRHPTRSGGDWRANNTTQIVHFMGAAKPGLRFVDVPQLGHCPDTMCVDVDQCAVQLQDRPGQFKGGKHAYVITHSLHKPSGERLHHNKALEMFVNSAKDAGADLVLLVPNDDVAAHALTEDENKRMTQLGFKIHKVEWVLPPHVHDTVPTDTCNTQKYMRLHTLALKQYNTIVVANSNLQVHNLPRSLLDCAAQNKVLATSGSDGGVVHSGFVALTPSDAFYKAALDFIAHVDLSVPLSTWGRAAHTGLFQDNTDCFAGVLHAMMVDEVHRNMSETMFKSAKGVRPTLAVIDRCKWHHEPSDEDTCASMGLNCTHAVVVHHKSKCAKPSE